MATIELRFQSRLAASASDVWAVVSTMDGVNDELRPFVRMTHPPHLRSLTDGSIEPGTEHAGAGCWPAGCCPSTRAHAGARAGDRRRSVRRGVHLVGATTMAAPAPGGGSRRRHKHGDRPPRGRAACRDPAPGGRAHGADCSCSTTGTAAWCGASAAASSRRRLNRRFLPWSGDCHTPCVGSKA